MHFSTLGTHLWPLSVYQDKLVTTYRTITVTESSRDVI